MSSRNNRAKALAVLLVGVALVISLVGCGKAATPSPAAKPMVYQVDPTAQITKIAYSFGEGGFCNVAVSVKNISTAPHAYEVAIRVNDGVESLNRPLDASKETVAPGKEKVFPVLTGLKGSFPEKIQIKVAVF